MSAERTPSLSGAIPCFELFMTTWEHLRDNEPRLAPYITAGIDCATKYYRKMDETHAYVVSMCECSWPVSATSQPACVLSDSLIPVINPAIRIKWIQKHWGEDYTTRAIGIIKALVSLNMKSNSQMK